MENLDELFKLFESIIPNGAKKDFEQDGIKYHIEKDKDNFNIRMEVNKFDDSSIKELAKDYKECIKELDDCLFMEATEELGTKLNLNEFNDLLDLEHFTEEQASNLEEMIDVSSEIISSKLEHKIQRMVELYDKFSN